MESEAPTTLAQLLEDAIRAKARERGVKYTYRDLEQESGVHYSYVLKVKRGRLPSRWIIRAWSKALQPYFPEDRALVLSGFMPEDKTLIAMIHRALEMPAEAVANVLDLYETMRNHDDELLDDILSPDAKYGRRFKDDEDDEDDR